MLEFAPTESQERYQLDFAGDTFNTAIHLSRLGMETHYITLLGPDPYSDAIRARAASENIQTELMLRSELGLPGLYLIENEADGERHFHYWRSQSIARQLFTHDKHLAQLLEQCVSFDFVYLSGITLAVMALPAWKNFATFIKALRAHGVPLLFDPNWRSAMWPSHEHAQTAYAWILPQCEWVFPSMDDEQGLWDCRSESAVFRNYQELGVKNTVLKASGARAFARSASDSAQAQSGWAGDVVDTTGAGDAFNAGFIVDFLQTADLGSALTAAHQQAALTLSHRGAVPPR